jgi:RHS repeat-associated protein
VVIEQRFSTQPATPPWGRPNKSTNPVVSAMPCSRRSQVRAWNRPVHRHGEPPPRRLGAWLAWDSQQRLTQVSTPEHTATYQYDLLGRRVQRQITKPGFPPETTHYVYDGLQAVGEIRPQQSSSSLMTGLNLDEMLARVTTLNATNTTQARTYLTDALGSVMAQTQDNQSTLAGYSYSPYGQTQSTGNTEGDSVQYTGRENDNNGLYYYRARYYDPVLKRFLSEDPIGLAGGSLSFYAYVEGNPVSWTDPLGLWALGDPLPQSVVDACAGFGDGVSLGATALIRELMDTNDAVDFSSGAYAGGLVAGAAVTTRGYATGAELSIGRNFRLAPWGNRTGHPTGRWPHYHRRGGPIDAKGNPPPGQSIKRHRPWDKKSTDKCVCDRF